MNDTLGVGRRIREVRSCRGLSLRVTSDLSGISYGWLGKIERGEKPVNRQTLEALANTLKVAPSEFTGEPDTPENDLATATAAATLADVLSGWRIGEVPDAPGRPLPDILADLAAFHADRNNPTSDPQSKGAGDYPTQVDRLVPLIRDLLVAATDPVVGREALAPLITAYHVAGSISSRLRLAGMPSLAVDRMDEAAQKLDDPVWQGVADWGRAHFLSATNRPRQQELAIKAADTAPPERMETRGMAHLTAALAAAAQGNRDDADSHLSEASDIADHLGHDLSPWPAGVMQFGKTNVAIFKVSIGTEMGLGGKVAEFASQVRPETISRGRQASFYADLGRGLLAERKTRDQGIRAIARAQELAPQQIRKNVFARDAIRSLLTTARRDAGGRDLRYVAWKMGITPAG
ncbi:transcriptional regulator (plasmid) [Prauserella marina]|uniref:Helix-turn-helix domain-containing protein n=1 Tax=Prauserella marina TaxID=530584 RepID=A0A222W150_9PSEU|nr:helix-turn-helix transcriptional regulator [Prauserella marina]ASR39934.1 transcriptional regulator [Prauserella marina]PWV71436.1 helix-turn-helix protein [Prauserella marina]SDD97681.1 Helix-turn-helix domain-containing protein [Prauserella marina]